MNKQKIAAASAAMILLSGCSAVNSSSSETNVPEIPTWASAEYSSDSFTDYDLKNFSFTINDDFIPDTITEDNPNKIYFKSDLIPYMDISGYTTLYCDVSYYGEKLYEDTLKREGNSDVSYELIDLDGFQAAAVNYIDENEEKGPTGYSNYTAVCEGAEFEIFAYYPAENAEKAVPMINDIIRSAVYTSDYKLPTEEQHFENDIYSLDFGPEWFLNVGYKSESKLEDDGLEFSHMFNFAKAANDAEASCLLVVEVGSAAGSSAAQKADSAYEILSSKETSMFSDFERSQSEMLGQNAETVSYKMKSGDDQLIIKDCYIEYNGNVLRFKIHCLDDGSYDDFNGKVNDLIESIELK